MASQFSFLGDKTVKRATATMRFCNQRLHSVLTYKLRDRERTTQEREPDH